MLLTCGHFCQLVFDACVHVTHGEEDAPRQLVLVVQSEPLGEHLTDLGLEDLRAGQLGEGLVLEDGEVLRGLWLLAESLRVARRRCHLAENLRGNLRVGYVSIKVNLAIECCLFVFLVLIFLETLCAF